MTKIFSKCSDKKVYPDVTLMSFLSMHLPAFGLKFVQLKGYILFQGETITTLESNISLFGCFVFLFFVFLFSFAFFAELLTLMCAIIVCITRDFSKARLQIERKTFALFATRIALFDIY